MMRGITECCRFCTDKYEACHDHCEEYLSARNEWEKRKARISAAKNEEYLLYKYDKAKKRREK